MPAGRRRVRDDQLARAEAVRRRIKEAQDAAGLDTEDLARTADLPRRTVDSYFYKASRSPSFFLVAELAKALTLSLDDLAKEGVRS